MMFSAGTWALLIAGAVFTRWQTRLAPFLIGSLLLAEMTVRLVSPHADPGMRLLTVLTCCGFAAWSVTLRGQSPAAPWGAVAWIFGGLLVLGQSQDLLVIGLGWELLRQGVRLATVGATQPRPREAALLLSFAWWTAVAGLLLFAGTTEIPAIMHQARELYWPVREMEPVGRASLLFVGSVALLIVTLCAAMMLPFSTPMGNCPNDSRTVACGQLVLQWATVWVLARLFATGVPGLSELITTLVSVLVVAMWLLSVMALGRAERWSEIMDAAVRFHGGLLLCVTWALLVPVDAPPLMEGTLHSPAPLSFVWGQELLHGGVAIAALLAALSWRDERGIDADYIEASRGVAACHWWSTAWTLVPLASILGLPGLWGSWTRFASGATMLSVHAMREDELAVPIGSLIVVALAGLIAASYLLRAGIQLVSVLCWEPLIGRPRPPGNGWPQWLAAVLCVGLVVLGVFPRLITLLFRATAST